MNEMEPVVVAINTLSSNSHDGKGCTFYGLGNQEISGCLLSDVAADGWVEIEDESAEGICISTPGLQVSDEFEFEHFWVTFGRGEEDEREYVELCITTDPNWGVWFDAGCPK